MTRADRIVMFAIAAAGIVGGVALFVLAVRWAPTEPHHGQAVDGLDGLGTFFALLAGGGSLLAFAIAFFSLRRALRT